MNAYLSVRVNWNPRVGRGLQNWVLEGSAIPSEILRHWNGVRWSCKYLRKYWHCYNVAHRVQAAEWQLNGGVDARAQNLNCKWHSLTRRDLKTDGVFSVQTERDFLSYQSLVACKDLNSETTYGDSESSGIIVRFKLIGQGTEVHDLKVNIRWTCELLERLLKAWHA